LQAQLAVAYPHLAFETVRGNLNTRLAKLEASDPAARDVPGKCFSALCLAAAGVIRMGWREKIGQFVQQTNKNNPPHQQQLTYILYARLLNDDTCLHAVGQGSVAIECRADDERTLRLVRALQHMPTALYRTHVFLCFIM
jgi:hydroxymethylbilane synthase